MLRMSERRAGLKTTAERRMLGRVMWRELKSRVHEKRSGISRIPGEEFYNGDRDAWHESLNGAAPHVEKLAEVLLGREPASHLDETCWSYENGKLTLVITDEFASRALSDALRP